MTSQAYLHMPQTPHPEAAIHTCALRCLVWQVFTCIQTPYPGLVPFGGVCGAATSQARRLASACLKITSSMAKRV